PRVSNPLPPRAVLSTLPVARDADGRSLPRAYVARRRTSPKGVSFSLTPEEVAADPARPAGDPAPPPPAQRTQPVRARAIAPGTGRGETRPGETRPAALPPLVLSPEPSTAPVILSREPAAVIVSPEPAVTSTPMVVPTPAPASPANAGYTPDVSP